MVSAVRSWRLDHGVFWEFGLALAEPFAFSRRIVPGGISGTIGSVAEGTSSRSAGVGNSTEHVKVCLVCPVHRTATRPLGVLAVMLADGPSVAKGKAI